MNKIFEKYLKKCNFKYECIDEADGRWDCVIGFDSKMLDEIGIKYKTISNSYVDCILTTNHKNDEELVFLKENVEDDSTFIWMWAIVEKVFDKNRQTVDPYRLFDSETCGDFEKAYPKIAKAMKRFITPILDEVTSETNFVID